MIYGFVMVECRTGKESEVYEALKGLKWVDEVHPLFGEYDFLLRVKAKGPDDLAHFIIDQVRRLDGVENTRTYLEASFGPDTLKKS
jgi:DNA-binding Lrp family transcriptional regulator